MLILAAATGFMAQRWVKRNFSRSPEEVELRRQQRIAKREKKLVAAKKKRATGESSGMLARGLKFIALLRTLIAALPSAWVNSLPGVLRIKAASGQQQAPTAQSPASVSTRAQYDGAGIKAR
jgi:hypothetical protein